MVNKMEFTKATKKQVKLRLAITGASGSGKTYSSLLLATSLSINNKIAVIDTENASSSLYARKFSFDVLTLQAPYTPERYIEAIKLAYSLDYEVLIIDSLSHCWEGEGGYLDIKNITNDTYSKKVSPRLRKLIQVILSPKIHTIVTFRSKTAYNASLNEKGKLKLEKLGTSPIQKTDIEYEFDIVFDLNQEHLSSCSKDRTEDKLFDGKDFFITEDTGKDILNWLNDGEEVKIQGEEGIIQTASLETLNKLVNLVKILEVKDNIINLWLKTESVSNINDFTEEQAQEYIKACEKQLQKKDAEKKIEMTKKIMNGDETKAETNLSDEQEKFLQEQKL
jgi:hypothetical protein